jgi:phytoene dehydrogenase-like protein
VREWLDQEFEQPAAREYIEAIIRLATYANAPELIPVADAARQLASAGDGVLYVDGGWRQLVRGLQDAAEAAGAEIRTGARIDALLGVDRITGVRLAGGETFEADAVVLAVPPGVARELAGGSAAIARMAESAVPARAACLDLGLTRLPNPRRRFGLGIDVPMYMSAHSFYAKLAPEGRVLLSVAKYLPVDEPRDAARDLAELESFLDLAQPGWQAFEEHRQYLPNMVVSSALPLPGLGIAGRPASKVDDIDGLFLAGDWVGDGGWLTDGTLGSARLASAAVSGWLAKKASRSLAGVS